MIYSAEIQISSYDIFQHPLWIASINMQFIYANLGKYHYLLMPIFPIRKKIKRNWY